MQKIDKTPHQSSCNIDSRTSPKKLRGIDLKKQLIIFQKKTPWVSSTFNNT